MKLNLIYYHYESGRGGWTTKAIQAWPKQKVIETYLYGLDKTYGHIYYLVRVTEFGRTNFKVRFL